DYILGRSKTDCSSPRCLGSAKCAFVRAAPARGQHSVGLTAEFCIVAVAIKRKKMPGRKRKSIEIGLQGSPRTDADLPTAVHVCDSWNRSCRAPALDSSDDLIDGVLTFTENGKVEGMTVRGYRRSRQSTCVGAAQ